MLKLKDFNKGFTLAEVLITLVIIGIVATMTVPTIIANTRKSELEVRMKQTYSILNNAVTRAVAENGPVYTWDEIRISKDDKTLEFFHTYIEPYLNFAKPFEKNSSYKKWGYTNMGRPGKESFDLNNEKALATLMNGSVIVDFSHGWYYHPEDKTSVEDRLAWAGIAYYIDVNGIKKPNYVGKDIHPYVLIFSSTKPTFDLAGVYDPPDIPGDKIDTYWKSQPVSIPKDDLKTKCRQNGSFCGALVQKNGWKFPKDYPLNI